jgi:hypothetical protein
VPEVYAAPLGGEGDEQLTSAELRAKASDLKRLARLMGTKRTRAVVAQADEAMRSSRVLIAKARRKLRTS